MKWFKHYTDNTAQDSRIVRLIEHYGVAGYGRYQLLLEQIIRIVDAPNERPRAEFTLRKWADILRLKTKNVQKFLGYLADISLISVEHLGDLIAVELSNCGKLLSDRAVSSGKRGSRSDLRLDKNSYAQLPLRSDAVRARSDIAENPAIKAAAKSSAGATKAFDSLTQEGEEQ